MQDIIIITVIIAIMTIHRRLEIQEEEGILVLWEAYPEKEVSENLSQL